MLFKIFEDEIPFSDPSGAAMSSFSVLAEFSRLLTAAAADSPRLPSPIHREQFSETIKQITWSLLGTCLFINYGERTTKCLKESLDGSWQVSIVDTC